MWIVKLALRLPYTFVVLALLIVFVGIAAIVTMPVDVFPDINIPVITVIWTYTGLPTQEMERRITTYNEFGNTSIVNDIRNMESQTMNGVSVVKIYFHPNVNVDLAMSQVEAVTESLRFLMPPGINPPWILKYSASSVPVLQLALSSDKMSESQLYDYGIYRIRQQISVVQGTNLPAPYGGKARQIMVDLDTQALTSKGLTAQDVVSAINAQNLALPSGTARIGAREYNVKLNNSPLRLEQLNDIPIRSVNGAVIYVRDVAHVRDGYAVQQNVVRANGARAVLLSIIKNGSASTLDVVNRVKSDVLPVSRASAPPGMKIQELFDQSLFVRAAVNGVLREGIIAACLTGLTILVFLGDWRSTLIVAISIPLSILSSIILLHAFGQTLNVMTLGGLSLAIGILVDDATVTIENIERLREEKQPLLQAILDGAAGIAIPTLVSTLTICIVFVSVIFLDGPAKFLFVPLALSVVFAMIASYVLSRSLVPVLVRYLSREPKEGDRPNLLQRLHARFNARFDKLRNAYVGTLTSLLQHRGRVLVGAGIVLLVTVCLLPFVGRDFFPSVDAGQIRMHVRGPSGRRIEESEHQFDRIESRIRQIIPENEREIMLDDIGLVKETYNLAYNDGSMIGSQDGEILVALKEGKHKPTGEYIHRIRSIMREEFPGEIVYFQPADIVNQILNFGLPAPIDVQVVGFDGAHNYEIAKQLEHDMRAIPGVVDAHLHQVVDAPEFDVNVDRTRAAEQGMTQQNVANSLLISLSSSQQTSPNFWVDPIMAIPYPVAAQTPMYRVASLNDLGNTTVTGNNSPDLPPALLSNLAEFQRGISPQVVNHSNVQPTFDVYASVDGRDMGGVAAAIQKKIDAVHGKLQPGNTLVMRGQVESMQRAFLRLGLGLLFAATFVYLLMVVNFQSWSDPFIIIMALPGAFCGMVWMLFLTHTTFSVPSLMGAIMSIGVACANSILLVTFANDQRPLGLDAIDAALAAGQTRLRPILMTALAMIVGMVPMALGLGEGGEQNAPLGRAVIGGLLLATFATLLFVPVVYTIIRKNSPLAPEEGLQ